MRNSVSTWSRHPISYALRSGLFAVLLLPTLMVHAEDQTKPVEPVWFGHPASYWRDLLKSEYPEDRIRAITMMEQHSKECQIYLPKLIDAYKDSGDAVRVKIIELLGMLEVDRESLSVLMTLTASSKQHSYYELLKYFAKLSGDKIAPLLSKGLGDQSSELRYFSALTLARACILSEECKAPLLKMMDENSRVNHSAALDAFAAMFPNSFDLLFKKIDETKDLNEKLEYVNAILHTGMYGALPRVTRVWKESDDQNFKHDIARAIMRMSPRTFGDYKLAKWGLKDKITDPDLAKQLDVVADEEDELIRSITPSNKP